MVQDIDLKTPNQKRKVLHILILVLHIYMVHSCKYWIKFGENIMIPNHSYNL